MVPRTGYQRTCLTFSGLTTDKDCVFDFKISSSNTDDVYMDYGLSYVQDCSNWIEGGHWSALAPSRALSHP